MTTEPINGYCHLHATQRGLPMYQILHYGVCGDCGCTGLIFSDKKPTVEMKDLESLDL